MYNQTPGYTQGQYTGQALKEDKKSGHGGMIAAGAGGLAVGALAGAALSGDSSDEGKYLYQRVLELSLTFDIRG